jgi:predicted nucleotidyltransferase
MGKVFTSAELESQNYPWPDAHYEAAAVLMGVCVDLRDSLGAVDSACVYGSVALGMANLRSDVDGICLLNRRENEYETRLQMARTIQEVEAGYRVPVDFSIWHADDWRARRGVSANDYLFLEHIVPTAETSKYRVGQPADVLRQAMTPNSAGEQLAFAEQSVESYLVNKTHFFTHKLSHGGTIKERALALQRAYELPSALGRKVLRVMSLREWESGHTDPHLADSSPDNYIRSPLAEGLVTELDDEGRSAAAWLMQNDALYSQLLESTVKGSTNLREYAEWIYAQRTEALQQALRLSLATQRCL